MIAIVNTDPNWGIGKSNELQVRISEDLKRFKDLTLNKVIIYGSKTMQTYPKGRPLPNRTNIVLTRNRELIIEGAIVCYSLAELLDKVEQLKQEANLESEDFIVVGGAMIYEMLLPHCNKCYVTRIDQVLPADSFFPNLDQREDWELIEQSQWYHDLTNDLNYSYLTYRRK